MPAVAYFLVLPLKITTTIFATMGIATMMMSRKILLILAFLSLLNIYIHLNNIYIKNKNICRG
jgi:hypothetical protein